MLETSSQKCGFLIYRTAYSDYEFRDRYMSQFKDTTIEKLYQQGCVRTSGATSRLGYSGRSCHAKRRSKATICCRFCQWAGEDSFPKVETCLEVHPNHVHNPRFDYFLLFDHTCLRMFQEFEDQKARQLPQDKIKKPAIVLVSHAVDDNGIRIEEHFDRPQEKESGENYEPENKADSEPECYDF